MLNEGWRHLRKCEACLACGSGADVRNRNTLCMITDDDAVVWCGKSGGTGNHFKQSGNGWLYRVKESEPRATHMKPAAAKPKRPPAWNRMFAVWWDDVDESRLARLAQSLGVGVESLERIGIGWGRALWDSTARWTDVHGTERVGRHFISGTRTPCGPDGVWVFPMRNELGLISGARVRPPSGSYYSVTGSGANQDQLFIPQGLVAHAPLLLPEGPTDLAALLTLNLNVAGRENNQLGNRAIRGLIRRLRPERIILIGEHDLRFNHRLGVWQWPGHEGPRRLEAQLAGCGVPVELAFPPAEFKDVREWVRAGATSADVTEWCESARRIVCGDR